MNKRRALAAAGAVTATALAATVAMGTNLGLFGLTNEPNAPGSFGLVGNETPAVPVAAAERTEVVDVPAPYYVSDGASDAGSAGTAGPPSPGVGAGSDGTSTGGAGGGGRASGRAPSGVAPTGGVPESTVAHPESHETHTPETHTPETESSETRTHETHERGAH